MKTLKILLLLTAVILSGFSGGSQGTGNGVNVPMKFKGVIIIDPAAENVSCTGGGGHHRTGWLEGNQTHGGRLITELSTWEILECKTNMSTYLNESKVAGVNTVANGDSYNYSCIMIINLATSPLDVTLLITIEGGTGRFEGATGEITLYGLHAGTGTIPVSGEGFISFSK